MHRRWPAVLDMALKHGARHADLEAAVHDAIRHSLSLWVKEGEAKARDYIGEEIWAFAARKYGGMKTISAAQTNLVESGIVRAVTIHIRHVFDYPDATAIDDTHHGCGEATDADVIGDRDIALIFVEIWAKVGVKPPVAEVRGLRMRRGEARKIITDVLHGAREMGLLDESHGDRSKLLDQRFRLHRIVLQRLAHKQVPGPRGRWQSPLSAYCGRSEPSDPAMRTSSMQRMGKIVPKLFRPEK